jgi:hypothetical protein
MPAGTTLLLKPYYEELQTERITRFSQRPVYDSRGEQCDIEEVEDEKSGYICKFAITDVLRQEEDYEELLSKLNEETFILKRQYHAAQKYLQELSVK